MSEVIVFNDNIYPYRERFRDRIIEIQPKNGLLMDHDEAIIFKGQFSPILLDGGGNPDPRSYKMLKIIIGDKPPEVAVVEIACHNCAKTFVDAVSLDKHITEFHLEEILDEKEKEKRRAEQKGKK